MQRKCEDGDYRLSVFAPPAGTLGYNESSFHMEMSQIGFSTHTLDVSVCICATLIYFHSDSLYIYAVFWLLVFTKCLQLMIQSRNIAQKLKGW